MNFTIFCGQEPASSDPQAAVACLLTGKPNAHLAPTRTTVHRSLNLLIVNLTLTVASKGFLGNDLRLTGPKL